MSMQFNPNQTLSTGVAADTCLEYLYQWKEWMVNTVGWAVSRSSNGTTGGAGDNIASRSDLSQWVDGVSESWFVMQDPSSVRELLFYRYSATDSEWAVKYSPADGFTDGDETDEPSDPADAEPFVGATRSLFSDTDVRWHCAADDAAPYGFWSWVHDVGNFDTGRHFMAMAPITDSLQPSEADAVALMVTGEHAAVLYTEFDDEAAATSAGRVIGFVPNQGGYYGIAIPYLETAAGVLVPNQLDIDDNGADITFPCFFARRASVGSGGYKGISSFVQLNGLTRPAGEIFASRTRLSVGDFNVEWDAASTPHAS